MDNTPKKTYPNSGRLNYTKSKIHPDSPDMYGEISVERGVLRQMLDEDDSDSVTLKINAWQKDGNYGPWFSVRINTYKPGMQQIPQQKQAAPEDDSSDVPF